MIGNFIEPRIFGTSLELHPIVVLLALGFWALIWCVTPRHTASHCVTLLRLRQVLQLRHRRGRLLRRLRLRPPLGLLVRQRAAEGADLPHKVSPGPGGAGGGDGRAQVVEVEGQRDGRECVSVRALVQVRTPTCSLTRWLARWLVGSLTHSLTHSLARSLAHSLTRCGHWLSYVFLVDKYDAGRETGDPSASSSSSSASSSSSPPPPPSGGRGLAAAPRSFGEEEKKKKEEEDAAPRSFGWTVGGFQGGEGADGAAEYNVENALEELDAPREWYGWVVRVGGTGGMPTPPLKSSGRGSTCLWQSPRRPV